MKASFETTILSISVSHRSSLVSQPARRARHQYLIGVQGVLRRPSSTSWSGQLHRRVWGMARWKRLEEALPTGSSRLVGSREPAGCARQCTVSLRWHREGTTGDPSQNIPNPPPKKMKVKNEQLRSGLVWEKVLFVCRVPLGPKCVKSHVRQYETAQHLPQAFASSIFLHLTTEQIHSSLLRRHSDLSHSDILWELCLEAASRWNSTAGLQFSC